MSALSLLAAQLQQRYSSQTPFGPERDMYVKELQVSISGTIQFTHYNSTINTNTRWLFEPNLSSTSNEVNYTVTQLSGIGAGTKGTVTEVKLYQMLFGVYVEYK